MAFVVWDDTFKVGIDVVDAQHEQLFAAVNELYEAMQVGNGRIHVGETLGFLLGYSEVHFETEERLMKETAYPGYARHKQIHDDLMGKVVAMSKRHDGGADFQPLEVLRFLREWLMHHTSREDIRMAEHIRAAAAKASGVSLNPQ